MRGLVKGRAFNLWRERMVWEGEKEQIVLATQQVYKKE